MQISTNIQKPWTHWHQRLHKKLLIHSDLLPKQESLLLAVSGGQDSMVLLKLLLDLQRIYKWNLFVWHGDHQWHQQSSQFAKELKDWCIRNELNFFCDKAKKEQVISEAAARDWRYKHLILTAKMITDANKSYPCNHIITGHTGSDRAETLLLNLARGTDLAGMSSLKEMRKLNQEIKLIRPLLGFSRNETGQICKAMNLPVWIDPSNANTNLSRNRVRQQIIPVLENLHPGSSMRMASLAERLSKYKEDQHAMASLLIQNLRNADGLCRISISELPLTARATILAEWLKQNGVTELSTTKLEELSSKIGKSKPPGCCQIANNTTIRWLRQSIQLEETKTI